jgi:hypothetical protein
MARRQTLDAAGLVLLLAIGGVVTAISALTKTVGTSGIFVLCVALIALPCFLIATKRRKRLAYLRAKYSDEQIVQRIMRRSYWDGQSEEQLVDSLGRPHRVDRQVMKTKRREVWKYSPTGKNRYRLRITLDQGQVVGWDAKGRA